VYGKATTAATRHTCGVHLRDAALRRGAGGGRALQLSRLQHVDVDAQLDDERQQEHVTAHQLARRKNARNDAVHDQELAKELHSASQAVTVSQGLARTQRKERAKWGG
jgi:hypothetical protein